jgi:hypothetical protein
MTSVALATATCSVLLGAGAALAEPGAPSTDTGSAPANGTPSTQTEAKKGEPAKTATVRGLIWDDKNKNGIRENGERGIPNVNVAVWDHTSTLPRTAAPKNLKAGPGGDPGLHFGFSDANGRYEVTEVAAGAVNVEVVGIRKVGGKEERLRFSPMGKGTNRAKDSDFAELGPEVGLGYFGRAKSDVAAGATLTLDAGTFPANETPDPTPTPTPVPTVSPTPGPDPKPDADGAVAGRVWNDKDRDGLQDKGEVGVAGIQVMLVPLVGDKAPTKTSLESLVPNAGSKAAVAKPTPGKTDAKGRYTFKAAPGKYVVFVLAGPLDAKGNLTVVWKFSKKGAGKDRTLDSDVELFEAPKIPAGALAVSDEVTIEKVKGGDKKIIDAGVYKNEKPAPAPGDGSLPVTGAALGGLVAGGMLLLGGGLALTVMTRRRRKVIA